MAHLRQPNLYISVPIIFLLGDPGLAIAGFTAIAIHFSVSHNIARVISIISPSTVPSKPTPVNSPDRIGRLIAVLLAAYDQIPVLLPAI